VAVALLVGPPSSADEWPLPRSLSDAVRMEQADALPITPFYSTPAFAGTQPGALLRQEDASGYALPTGARAVRILYKMAQGRDVIYPGLDHDPTMDKSTPDQLAWIRDRFAGKPFTGNCRSL
jgi:hypothetical protein